MSSQQTGHSTCACACRPRSCSHTKYAAPATSSKPGPPPKGRPGTLGIRRSIAGHLPIGKTARTGVALAAGPFQCGTTMPICGGIIDAGASCGTPGNAEPDQTRSRRPVALNHRSRTVSRSESAVAPTAESVFLPESWRCVVAGDILTVLREAPLQYRRQIGRALTRTGEDHIHHVAERDRIRRADGTAPFVLGWHDTSRCGTRHLDLRVRAGERGPLVGRAGVTLMAAVQAVYLRCEASWA